MTLRVKNIPFARAIYYLINATINRKNRKFFLINYLNTIFCTSFKCYLFYYFYTNSIFCETFIVKRRIL